MMATSTLPAVASLELDAMLADALVLSWSDLMPERASGLIHIEYHVGPRGSVEFMKVWAATIRGHWDLVCEHSMQGSGSGGGRLRFTNGYKSEGLEIMLDAIAQHREMLTPRTPPGTDRMIQIPPPTDEDIVAASDRMGGFCGRLAR